MSDPSEQRAYKLTLDMFPPEFQEKAKTDSAKLKEFKLADGVYDWNAYHDFYFSQEEEKWLNRWTDDFIERKEAELLESLKKVKFADSFMAYAIFEQERGAGLDIEKYSKDHPTHQFLKPCFISYIKGLESKVKEIEEIEIARDGESQWAQWCKENPSQADPGHSSYYYC